MRRSRKKEIEKKYYVKGTAPVYLTSDMDSTAKWFEDTLGWHCNIVERDSSGAGRYGVVFDSLPGIDCTHLAHFTGIHMFSGKPEPRLISIMRVTGIENMHEYITSKGWRRITDVKVEPCGRKTCNLTTVDGYTIEFVDLEFNEIRNAYIDVREAEREKIISFFKSQKDPEGQKEFEVNSRQASKEYNSQGRLTENYNMRIWKWVTVTRNNVHFLISLQPFERDKNSHALHVLWDLIGIYVYTEYSEKEAQAKMMVSQIKLPMDNEKLNELANIIRSLSDCYLKMSPAQFKKKCSEYGLF